MYIHDQTEEAYKNGYETGIEETIKIIRENLPSDKFSERYIMLATIITEILNKYKELKK